MTNEERANLLRLRRKAKHRNARGKLRGKLYAVDRAARAALLRRHIADLPTVEDAAALVRCNPETLRRWLYTHTGCAVWPPSVSQLIQIEAKGI